MTTYYALLDQPNSQQRTDIEFLIDNQYLIDYLDQHHLSTLSNQQQNAFLMALGKQYRSHYLPISGQEYLPISKQHPEINQLVGLHKILYQKLIYEHQPVYLKKINLN